MPDVSPNQPASPQPAAKSKAGPVAAVVVAALIVFGFVNSGDDDEPATTTSDARPALAADPDAAQDLTAALPETGSAGLADTAVVPDVVGLNHQLAQDTLQAGGFYLLHEEDATGQGRMLVLDRNWEVVSQSVAPGTTVSTDTAITLYAKKIGE
jgi:hypothetical protein